ncbi:stage III sporulation protein AF [Bacillus sp. FJAT-50079]|uniref:stage III sporulation protein AF n=1 Tax=Bacillus sp. FJAT-50079 TaxID=2833577 RepID=UPI001BC9C6B6|nr:stage III sporulation protein AF [Bacillus sp. FJAT-50079]MBS4209637.1 stage III sporulation protein AF [Bacillus sp. FJAT-50079]
MNAISEWVFTIIIFLLLAMVIDMLLPNSAMKKYTKLVTGLVLIAIIITPLFKLMSTDFETLLRNISIEAEQQFQHEESLLENKKREIQASLDAYTLEQMAVLMKADVEKELMERFGLIITNIDIKAEDREIITTEQLKKVKVTVERGEGGTREIVPVHIQINGQAKEEKLEDFTEIIDVLSTNWEIPISIIEIVAKGGADVTNEQAKRAS